MIYKLVVPLSIFFPFFGFAYSQGHNNLDSILPITYNWLNQVQDLNKRKNSDREWKRNFIIEWRKADINQIIRKIESDDEVCESFNISELETIIKKVGNQQSIPTPSEEVLPEIIEEWKNSFKSNSILICESVSFWDDMIPYRYWHHYLFKSNYRRQEGFRLSWIFETTWENIHL